MKSFTDGETMTKHKNTHSKNTSVYVMYGNVLRTRETQL